MDDTQTNIPALPPAAQRLRQGRLALADAAGTAALDGYPEASSVLMDTYFRDRLEELGTQSPELLSTTFALIAVGGYGRGELCPASDVDVLVLYDGAIPKIADELSRGLFHPLWDLGLDLGHGVRALDDCLRLAREDTQVLTSLLDTRRIAGDEGLVSKLLHEFSAQVLKGYVGVFGQWVLTHNAGRRAEYGDSSGLLEPDLKNGLGGLRDVHQIHWLLSVDPALRNGPSAPFTTADLALLQADYRFVLAARTALHLTAKRKTDRLNFDFQPQVARQLGFTGAEPDDDRGGLEAAMDTGLAVEAFLSRLHQSMTRIRAMRQACWLEAFPPHAEACPLAPGGTSEAIYCGPTGMALRDPATAQNDAALILELYVAAARQARPVCFSAQRATRAALAVPERRAAFSKLPGILPALLEIFRASGQPTESSPPQAAPAKPKPGGLAKVIKRLFAPAPVPGEAQPQEPDITPAVATALQSMLDTGLMSALVPEFSPVEHLVQFDDFHIHPVGKHTLEVVRALATMLPEPQGAAEAGDILPELRERAGSLPNFDRLLLAAFCHDLAKPDRDHSSTGAALAETILRRLGANKATRDDVAFLVKQHLVIPKIATRRDLADESVAVGLAELCGSVERLDMLHLLAVADSQSTGPRAWNPWTASLFDELTRKARRLLTDGPLAAPHAVDKSRHVREAALALAAKPFTGLEGQEPPLSAEYAERCLERMPARALLVLDAPTIVRHMHLAKCFQAALDEDMVRKPTGKAGIGVVEIDAVSVKGKAFQVSLAALDQPGLFAAMAGVLALHDLNILSAEVLTWNGGPGNGGGNLAVDVFLVQEPAEGLYLEDLWQRVRRAVSYALTGKLSLEYRLEQKRTSPLNLPSRAPKSRRKIRVDNDVSDFYTVIEVAAPDRLGLLHDLALSLSAQHLRIHLARIATSAGRIHDVFYLRTDEGLKLRDPVRMDEVKKALLAAAR
ncbi:MAG: HD domain-containing protein [Humidesulfovibrio sp.]|nr:HD domain-containing protein [Humidesulfovibrio sp.]